jgi:predicted ester cyclase
MTNEEARSLAADWIAAWNAHDLEAILAHYGETVELTSPVAARLLGLPGGRVTGKPALRAYFERGLAAYPELRFHLEQVFCGVASIVLVYVNQAGSRTAEFMEISPAGKAARVVANYSA